MGKTYRRSGDDDGRRMKLKNHRHIEGKKASGMRIISDIFEGDDIFDDEVNIRDEIVINKTRDEQS